MPWTERAICHGADPELFFPIGYGTEFTPQIEEATAICKACPVRGDCLEEAIASRLSGIWGGTTDNERHTILRRRRRRVSA